MEPIAFNYLDQTIIIKPCNIHTKSDLNKTWYPKTGLDISVPEGMYFIYNNMEEIIYVGWSVYLQSRVRAHLSGNTHTKYFYDEIYEIRSVGVEELDKIRVTLYGLGYSFDDMEYALIDIIRPKYNIRKPNPAR